jgi:hypothetical protein
VLQDIHSVSPVKNLAPESESPKVDKPPSPSVGKSFPEMSKRMGLENANASTDAASNLTSPSAADSRCDAANQSPWPGPTENQEASP